MIKVLLIPGRLPRDPENPSLSFVFDEIRELVKQDISMDIIRLGMLGESKIDRVKMYGILSIFKNILSFNEIYREFENTKKILNQIYGPIKSSSIFFYSIAANNIAKRNNFDIIHSHFADYQSFVGSTIKKIYRKPLVITVHGYDVLIEPSVKFGLRLKPHGDTFVRNNLSYADAVIANSRILYDECIKLGVKEEKLYLIHQGVDTERFRPDLDASTIREKYKINGKFVILSMKALEPIYGIEYLIQAISSIVHDYGYKDVVLMLGGKGSLKPYFIRLVKKLGIKENVIFTGVISRKMVPYYYVASDVVVVPSLMEGFGIVGLEALASGKPVIASRVGGFPEYIIDGKNGFLVSPANTKELVEKVLFLIENPKEVKKMGQYGRKIVEEKFNLKLRARKIATIYRSLSNLV